MADQTELPGKKDVARALLLKGTLFVHLDPREPQVSVPMWLRNQPQLVLQLGLDMPIPIPDLRVDDHGVYGTLSFNRSPFTCKVPWDAVFAVFGEDGASGMVWPESMPDEIAAEVEREGRRNGVNLSPLRPKRKREREPLTEVGAESGEYEGLDDAPETAPEDDPDGRLAPLPALAELEDDGPRRPPADLAARRHSAGPPTPAGQGASGGASPSDRPSRRKVKLPPYLRVVK